MLSNFKHATPFLTNNTFNKWTKLSCWILEKYALLAKHYTSLHSMNAVERSWTQLNAVDMSRCYFLIRSAAAGFPVAWGRGTSSTWVHPKKKLTGTFSGTFGTFSGTSLNLIRRLHQCTRELFWAKDPTSLRYWGKIWMCVAGLSLMNWLKYAQVV